MDDDRDDRELDKLIGERMRWEQSLEGRLARLRWDLTRETEHLDRGIEALEQALEERRARTAVEWREREKSILNELIHRARTSGVGDFSTSSELMAELARTEPWERSPRADLYNEWRYLCHDYDERHRYEMSASTDSYLRYGGVFGAFAILERYLKLVCELVREYRKSSLQLKDLAKVGANGNIVGKCATYLSKVHGVHLPEAAWDAVRPFVYVRNALAHSSEADLPDIHKKFRAWFGECPTVTLRGADISLEKGFVTAFTGAIHGLFNALEKELNAWSRLRSI